MNRTNCARSHFDTTTAALVEFGAGTARPRQQPDAWKRTGTSRPRPLAAISTCTKCTAAALLSFAFVARADQVDDFLRQQMQEHRIPGMALRVIRHGEPIKTATYGLADVEQNVPVKPETVFEIGSITKQFTAAGILLLAQDGKLSVDDKISKHLQNLPFSWTNVTIQHLLSHTSGIKNYTGLPGFELTKHLTQNQFIALIGKQPLDFEPGSSFKYCNTGFNLLGFIIENVSGRRYWDFMAERVFKPLGMNSTTNRSPGNIIPNRAHGYEQTNHVWINRDYDLTDIFSAGAIASTMGDLTTWNTALDGTNLLSAATKERMWRPRNLNDGKSTKYGFGWYVDAYQGHKNIYHGGSTSGFSASIQRFPDDELAVILLTNTDEQIATTLARRIASFYFQK